MAERVPARLTAAEGHRFGLTVGGAFLLLAAITWWRDHLAVSAVFATLGGLLAVAALTVPTRLGPIERAWMAFARALSKITTPIAMSIIYLLVIFPIGALKRTLGTNPMVHEAQDVGYWKKRPDGARPSASLTRQF